MKNLQLRIGVTVTAVSNLMRSKTRTLIRSERGDVPGWVLITVMTAGLVVGLWSIAGPQLKTVLSHALRSVTAP
ncbi:MAG: hypothetical protein NTW81_04000 [Actinobacteria bacterium]|nr:hypothetical protein [Actinomycetota bacterium]